MRTPLVMETLEIQAQVAVNLISAKPIQDIQEKLSQQAMPGLKLIAKLLS